MNKSKAIHFAGDITPLRKLNSLVNSNNPRAPFANMTNAKSLMGDISDDDDDGHGDPDYGDPDYGDPSVSSGSLALYNTLIGDPIFGKKKMKPRPSGNKFSQMINSKAKQKARLNKEFQHQENRNSVNAQIEARRMMGKVSRNHQYRFFDVSGSTLNSAQISPTEHFVVDMLKNNLDRQQSDTPFEVDVIAGTFAGVTWTLLANGLATPRFYVTTFITVGVNALSGTPGMIWNVTGTLPTIQGNLSITIPFSLSLGPKWYSRLQIFPWILVTNKPLLVLGQYSNAAPMTYLITGLPSTATVTLVIPGSQHVWTIGERNRLL